MHEMMDPQALISPEYHEPKDAMRRWLLMRMGIRRTRLLWTTPLRPSKAVCFIFREILYLNRQGVAVGRGQAWLPLNRISFRIVAQCIKPWSPKPLGIVLKETFDSDLLIIVRRGPVIMRHSGIPYWASEQEVISYERIHTQASTRRVIAFSREDFLPDAVKGDCEI